MDNSGRGSEQRLSQSASPLDEVNVKRLSVGPPPIGSERGPSPGVTAGSNANPVVASARNSSDFDSLASSGILDPSDTEGIKARVERKRIEHERQRDLQRQKFEEEMRHLEQQQREEEARLLRQDGRDQSSTAIDAAQAQPSRSSLDAARTSASTSATPPFPATIAKSPSVQLINSLRASASSSPAGNALGSALDNDTEAGWTGSNVPGLAPLSNARSNPSTRRPSRDAALVASGRDSGSSPHDLANSFNRLSVGAACATPGSVSAVPGSRTASTTGLPAGASRLLSRNGHGFEDDNTLSVTEATSGSAGMTPVFNERFLFDDELDAEDSAFVRKYNLSGDDDKFPVLLRNDKYAAMPSQLSTSSKALDLAPLNKNEAHFSSRDGTDGTAANGTGPRLSEWPQFQSRVREDQYIDRRGRTEHDSPRLGASNPATRPLGGGQPATRGSAGGPIDRQLGLSGAPSSTPSPHSPSHGHTFGALAGRPDISGRGHPSDENVNGAKGGYRGNASLARVDGASARLSSGSQMAHREDGSSFNTFGIDGSASRRLTPLPPAGAFNDGVSSQDRNSGFYPGFGNASAIDYGFGYEGADEPLTAEELAARKGELDINTRLEDLEGEIFTLCKDQHGCRYLQKKLEEGVPTYRDMIFAETFPHFADLMTDPFGNYLCQKMLEFCTDEQRDLIVESVSADLVTISLNMHGTRAVQKTIDFLSTSRQIHSIILALSMNVVTLIKDLNGNHVIQKCLNRLGSEDNQFIYNAVAAHCVEVATHRHGCCVLQRCVDHASDKQRVQLVQEITYNALTLVQDPFGNYVVQYILDLNDARFTEAVIRQFIGNVCLLSVQKFSSNVIEKCIRVSPDSVRRLLVEELLNRARLEKLLRDSFANYVVQTALDYSDPIQRAQLVECIRPILPMIRNTPYGKRIQSKLQRESFDVGGPGAGGLMGISGNLPPPGSAAGNAHYQQLLAAAAQQQQQHYATMAALAAAQGQGHGGHPRHYQSHPQQMGGGYPSSGGGGGGGYGRSASQHVSALPPPHHLYGGPRANGHAPPTGPSRGGGYGSPFLSGNRGYAGNGSGSHHAGSHGRGHYQSSSVGYNQGPF